jgi:glycosyltransferase involved in cell wall biosynthesis
MLSYYYLTGEQMKIDYINGPKTDKIFGRSKYQREIFKRLEQVKLNIIEYKPLAEIIKNKINENSSKPEVITNKKFEAEPSINNQFFSYIINSAKNVVDLIDQYRYNHIIKKEIKEGYIKYITSQELAYSLKSIKMDRTVVVCYDLIPWAYDGVRSHLWQNIMAGLELADNIITISEFSKDEILKYTDYPEDKIHIVYPAVDHALYYENRSREILNKIDILNEQKVLLYVGSETPRQNVYVLIKAFALLKKKIPDIKLIKIGESQSFGAREKILKLITDLNLEEDIIFVGYVPEEDMPRWYNAADILVYPCDYAGFGLPPLEAMACGTPVITSNTTSLPEVVNDAGIMIDPKDHKLMADKIFEVLNDESIKNEMVKKGLKQSKRFIWEESAKKTLEICKNMI